ncbi:hypothetical protein B0H63DRAFT_525941 [Podospora didyma]|uniref:RING-type domain-containing protein n=1 Tax=Podospora didyma TaxID=330526 RepID=A0AAE0KDD0_9PEZI|nr:hypothetical protein B0H63DRAFT_525941 [Podospora didyma]
MSTASASGAPASAPALTPAAPAPPPAQSATAAPAAQNDANTVLTRLGLYTYARTDANSISHSLTASHPFERSRLLPPKPTRPDNSTSQSNPSHTIGKENPDTEAGVGARPTEHCWQHVRKWLREGKGRQPTATCPVCYDDLDIDGLDPASTSTPARRKLAVVRPCGHMTCVDCLYLQVSTSENPDTCPLCKYGSRGRWVLCNHIIHYRLPYTGSSSSSSSMPALAVPLTLPEGGTIPNACWWCEEYQQDFQRRKKTAQRDLQNATRNLDRVMQMFIVPGMARQHERRLRAGASELANALQRRRRLGLSFPPLGDDSPQDISDMEEGGGVMRIAIDRANELAPLVSEEPSTNNPPGRQILRPQERLRPRGPTRQPITGHGDAHGQPTMGRRDTYLQSRPAYNFGPPLPMQTQSRISHDDPYGLHSREYLTRGPPPRRPSELSRISHGEPHGRASHEYPMGMH